MDIDGVVARNAATDAHFGTRLAGEIGLLDIALDAVAGQFADEFDDVLALLDDGLRQTEDRVDFVEHAIELLFKVLAVVDDAQMLMSGPSLNHLLVEFAGKSVLVVKNNLVKIFYWSVIDLQCCISFRYTAK